jgi:hypothetical protein
LVLLTRPLGCLARMAHGLIVTNQCDAAQLHKYSGCSVPSYCSVNQREELTAQGACVGRRSGRCSTVRAGLRWFDKPDEGYRRKAIKSRETSSVPPSRDDSLSYDTVKTAAARTRRRHLPPCPRADARYPPWKAVGCGLRELDSAKITSPVCMSV